MRIITQLAGSVSSLDLAEHPSLQGLNFFFIFLPLNVFMLSEHHMPSRLITTDGQEITFFKNIIGKVAPRSIAAPISGQ